MADRKQPARERQQQPQSEHCSPQGSDGSPGQKLVAVPPCYPEQRQGFTSYDEGNNYGSCRTARSIVVRATRRSVVGAFIGRQLRVLWGS
jgi:hypothetical protein